MSEHTPGPWEVQGDLVVRPDGYSVAECQAQEVDGQYYANARLIAAAPDLLEALGQCLEVMDEYHVNHDPAFSNATAAIAKAKGERGSDDT